MWLRRCVPVLALGLAAAGLAAPVDAAPPATYSPVAPIPGSAGLFNHTSATSADGTDAVIHLKSSGPSLAQIDAFVRLPGRTAWRAVPPRMKNMPSVQDVVVAPIGAGDFQIAWVQYNGGTRPEVYTSRLRSRTRTWSAPTQVFKADPVYDHAGPSIGVAADGTIVIGAYAPTKESQSPPVYRAVVGVRYPGASSFKTTFLSPADKHSGSREVSVSSNGYVVVPFIVGYNLADMTVYAAVKQPGKNAPWRIKDLSVTGDAQTVSAGIGANGRVGVVWPAPSSAPWSTIRIATTTVGPGVPTWTRQDVATGGGTVSEPHVLVARDGDMTVVYNANGAAGSRLTARQLTGSTFGAPTPFTPADRTATGGSYVLRPDGKVAVLYGLYTFTPFTPHGLHVTTLTEGVPSAPVALIPGATGSQNQFALGVDAASRSNVVYARGFPPPATDLAWMGQAKAKPDVMTGPSSGKYVKRAKVKRLRNQKVRCTSGFWVEASLLGHKWYRNAHKIKGATHQTYRWGTGDKGKKLTCRVIAKNSFGTRVLKSRPKKVG